MTDTSRSTRLTMLVVFTATVFVSASLLFVVQPMVGKMILPFLGGSASVWTTCMLFFQGSLVAGYLYAHGLAQRLDTRTQVGLHLALIVAAAATSLPMEIGGEWLRTDSMPAGWLILSLVVTIGLPLFVVSSSAPLIQHWFGFTDHPEAEDPYFLYAASNVGSMLALLGYPFVVERFFALDTQAWLWAGGFGCLLLLTAGCGYFAARPEGGQTPEEEATAAKEPAGSPEADTDEAPGLTWKRRGWWVLVTFIPSSLMLGVTHFLTTDLASVPLLWVIPLSLYLLSYILVFARLPIHRPTYRMAIPLVTLVVLAGSFLEYLSVVFLGLAHLWMFFLFAMYFHGEVARDRPHPRHLTDYYIWMAVGGALGGLFNALLAPMLFDRAVEYFVILALGLALIPPTARADTEENTENDAGEAGWERWLMALLVAGAAGVYLWSSGLLYKPQTAMALLGVVLMAAVALTRILRPRFTGAVLAATMVAGLVSFEQIPGAIEYRRSFFANYTVYDETTNGHEVRGFLHGTTTHGLQVRDEGMRQTPFGYHHPNGPVGQVFRELPHQKVGVLGLGVGAMAAYAEDDQHFVFYEIDPVVEDIAREHFTYLEQCGQPCEVKIGDGRKLLDREKAHSFDLLFLDAYNSDSVPTHLLTREALKLYLSKLDEDGVLVFHVSNWYLNIEGVVGALAEEAGLVARTRSHVTLHPDLRDLVSPTTYTIVARETADLRALEGDPVWRQTDVADVVWTDDYSNIFSVFDWRSHTSTDR